MSRAGKKNRKKEEKNKKERNKHRDVGGSGEEGKSLDPRLLFGCSIYFFF